MQCVCCFCAWFCSFIFKGIEQCAVTQFNLQAQAIWDEIGQSSPNPKLGKLFDFYLNMVWQLSLSIPLPYVDGHLFDMVLHDWAEAFELSNEPKGQARKVELSPKFPIRKQFGLNSSDDEAKAFDVFFDGLKLFRPIKFKGLPTTANALKKPLVFIGKCREEFLSAPVEFSGGTLDFEAYIFWTPKIAPTEHQGSLVRIHGASGTLFDPSFMRYQIAESTRLRQITCEIFVKEGLDSALNIDRESFNSAHPHSVYITKWLYNALRQFSNAQKKLGKEATEKSRGERAANAQSEIQKVAADVWAHEMDDLASVPPSVEIVDEIPKPGKKAVKDAYVFERASIFPGPGQTRASRQRSREPILEEKLKAITQILASYELLDGMPKNKQERLLNAIYKILATEG